MIIVDTREQANKKILDYFDRNQIEWANAKLDFGDYMNPISDNKISVERKKDLLEFANNCGKDHARFKNELERADASGYTLHVLIGCEMNFSELERWVNPRAKRKFRKLKDGTIKEIKQMDGAMMLKIIKSWQKKHNLTIEFCPPKKIPARIVELLQA